MKETILIGVRWPGYLLRPYSRFMRVRKPLQARVKDLGDGGIQSNFWSLKRNC
jgi:hypothetical protein